MVRLFELDTLVVTTIRGFNLTADVHCVLLDVDGAPVATAQDRAGVGRTFARVLGSLGRQSTYAWDVLDADGNRLLDVVKPKQRLRGPSPTVSLVDGTPVGRAVRRGAGLAPYDLLNPAEVPLGRCEPALGQGVKDRRRLLFYRINDADGAPAGEILHLTGDPWGFEIAFVPGVDLAVRVLSIAVTLCLVQERLAPSSL